MTLHATATYKVAEHRGAPRVFVESQKLIHAGFHPGVCFSVRVDHEKPRLTLVLDEAGTHTVSRRKGVVRDTPVIDLNSNALLESFKGLAAVRMIVRANEIHFLPLASSLAAQERFVRLSTKLATSTPLDTASICAGAGLMSFALEEGYRAGGVETRAVIVNEIDSAYSEHAITHNPVVGAAALILNSPLQEIVQDGWLMERLPKVEIAEISLPCSGASSAGKAKRSLVAMEEHPEVGHLVAAALMLLQKLQPAIIVAENVPAYKSTGSAWIMRHMLRDMGYTIQETELHGRDFGVLEDRQRWFMVATTSGVTVTLDDLKPTLEALPCVEAVLDSTIKPDDARWTGFQYLKVKQERDVAKGNGFMMQAVNPSDKSVPTLRKGYAKGGSTDPLLVHPNNPDLLRKFTSSEHARIKGFPETLLAGLSETTAHQILGQAVLFKPVFALGKRIAHALRCQRRDVVPQQATGYSLCCATG